MFRFTIRDVLWLTALVAMACAWWVHDQKAAAIQRENKALQFKSEFMIANAKGLAGIDFYEKSGEICVSYGSKIGFQSIPK